MQDNMQVDLLKPFPPGNPFHHDAYRMGMRLGKNVIAMFEKFDHEQQPYIILVNTDTGERLKVTMP